MEFNFWEKEKSDVDEVVADFQRRARALIADGDLDTLKQDFSRSLATARSQDPRNQAYAVNAMRATLRDALTETVKDVEWGWFDDL